MSYQWYKWPPGYTQQERRLFGKMLWWTRLAHFNDPQSLDHDYFPLQVENYDDFYESVLMDYWKNDGDMSCSVFSKLWDSWYPDLRNRVDVYSCVHRYKRFCSDLPEDLKIRLEILPGPSAYEKQVLKWMNV